MDTPRPVVVETRRVDPDPSIASAVGRHHSLATAVADLVDNSVDAHARNVLIRVLQRDERAVGLLVIDDGDGMDTAGIDRAMGYAHRREYATGDLGHFGIGLKAASLSQADTLWVWSRRHGVPPVGRGLERSTVDDGPLVQTFSTADAELRMAGVEPGFALPTGTVVEWRDVRGFLQSPDQDEQRSWLESALEDLRTHLGIVLHRILTRGDVAVRIDVLDEDYPDFGPGAQRTVEPVDPFAWDRPGHTDTLTLELPTGSTQVRVHRWPAGSTSPNWSLGGRPAIESQGLYIHRHDRLLQAGGWNELVRPHRDLNLVRVEVDLDDALAPYVTINPEKTGVVLRPVVVDAWNAARTADGRGVAAVLDAARAGAQDARRRNPSPVTLAEPGRGFASSVFEAMEENAHFPDGDPVDVRWRALLDDEVFRVDIDARTLWLNSRYRPVLGGDPGLRSDDAQVVKSLLLWLVGDHVTGMVSGAREKRVERALQAVLLAAVRHEDPRAVRPGRHALPTQEDDL